jgi:nucleoid-associated protein YgaU
MNMNFRNKIMAFFTSVLLCGMISSLSCSHAGGTKSGGDDLFSGVGSDAPKDGDSSSNEVSADAELGGATKDASESDPTANKEEASLGQSLTPPSTPTADATPAPDSKPADALPPETKPEEAGMTPLAPTDSKTPQADVASLNNPAAAPLLADSKEAKPEALNDPALPPSTPDMPKLDAAPAAQDTTAAATLTPKKAKTATKANVTSSVPTIPTESILKKGTALNRYYILRHGDTPSPLSELIYSSQGRDQDLLAWNPGEWKAGRILFYASPVDPNDTSMKSFYEERGIQAESYTVKQGDWLSKIAENRYGSSSSWKEIALANGMKTPDKIEVGTEIKVYPAKLLSANLAENTKVEPAATSPKLDAPKGAANEQPNLAANTVLKAPIQTAPPELKVEPVPMAALNPAPTPVAPVKGPERKVASAKLADAEVGGFFKEHLFGFFAAAAVFLVAFLMIRRAKRADFFD